MANFNRIILAGNLTRDPELRVLPQSQTEVCDFGMAVNHRYKTQSGEQREEVLFIDCAIFGTRAKIVKQYFAKGKPILVEGRLKLDTWEDKQGGGKRSKHSVIVDNFEFVGRRDDQPGGGGGGGGYYAPSGEESQVPPPPRRTGGGGPPPNRGPAPQGAPQRPQQSPQPAEQPFGDEQQFKEDDIPF